MNLEELNDDICLDLIYRCEKTNSFVGNSFLNKIIAKTDNRKIIDKYIARNDFLIPLLYNKNLKPSEYSICVSRLISSDKRNYNMTEFNFTDAVINGIKNSQLLSIDYRNNLFKTPKFIEAFSLSEYSTNEQCKYFNDFLVKADKLSQMDIVNNIILTLKMEKKSLFSDVNFLKKISNLCYVYSSNEYPDVPYNLFYAFAKNNPNIDMKLVLSAVNFLYGSNQIHKDTRFVVSALADDLEEYSEQIKYIECGKYDRVNEFFVKEEEAKVINEFVLSVENITDFYDKIDDFTEKIKSINEINVSIKDKEVIFNERD